MIVTTNQGKIRGKESRAALSGKKYYQFLGIPYAKPPLDDLRFKPPQKAENWTDVLVADAEKSDCIQSRNVQGPSGSEDCLYLNVFTPTLQLSNPDKILKPVMVNIHGGGFFWFSGSTLNSSPDNLIDYNVVLVTFNYRLNVLGFLNLGLPDCPGNVGLKDQLMALQWVKENIESFGGDPNNVTLFGQSAGASSIHLHMMSPLSENLFHKCILQSGYGLSTWSFSECPENRAFELGTMLGYHGADKMELLDFLKRTPAKDLIETTRLLKAKIRKKYPGICSAYPFLPSIERIAEGAFLTDHPKKLLQHVRKMPVIMGMVDKEGGNMFIKESETAQILHDQFAEVVRINIPAEERNLPSVVDKVKQFYFSDKTISDAAVNEISNFYTDVYFKDFYEVEKYFLKDSGYPLYTYQFCYVGELNRYRVLADFEGAIHGAEHFYLFGSKFFYQNPFFSIPDDDVTAIKRLCTLWTNFAKSSNPNEPRTPSVEWQPTTLDRRRFLKIDKIFHMQDGRINEKRYEFWDQLADICGRKTFESQPLMACNIFEK